MAIEQKAIQELIDKEPFRPFNIITSSGKEYPVKDPRLVVVLRADVFYAFPKKDRWTTIAISHITALEVGQTVS
ncbi:MAG: hypothetical protein FWD53_04245 [Phycisphaerales bacterium]|nr:hypothetical protein [Phycisphaerales bacterium]